MAVVEASVDELPSIRALLVAQNERDGTEDRTHIPRGAYVVHDAAAVVGAGWIEPAERNRELVRVYARDTRTLDELIAFLLETSSQSHRADTSWLRIERVLGAKTEQLSDDVRQAYVRHGFDFLYEELEMTRDIEPPGDASGIPGVEFEPWTPALDSPLRDTYNAAFATRGVPPITAEEWEVSAVSKQAEFSEACSVVATVSGLSVGFCLCVRDGSEVWIDALGVRPDWRGRGIASSMLVRSLACMKHVGAGYAVLRVNVNNETAIALYRRLGFGLRRKHVVWRRRSEAVRGERARYTPSAPP
jgi:ribosomal protein S18 acetylase RimI-like enzyme